MDEEKEIVKRRKLNLDYEKCVICQEDDRKKKIVKTGSSDAFGNLLSSIKQRFEYRDPEIYDCYERIDGIPVETLTRKCFYHSECYKKVTNISKLNRLSKKHEAFISSNHGVLSRDESNSNNAQTFDLEEDSSTTSKKSLRSNLPVNNKDCCIICQNKGGKLRKVEFLETGKKMLNVSKVLPDQGFFIRMNSIPNPEDAVANDVVYHLKCWVTSQRSAMKLSQVCEDIQEIEDINRVIADVEIINIVKNMHTQKDGVIMDMNNINKTYNNLVGNDTNDEVNYKRYLKMLLKDNIEGLIFSKPPNRRLSERVCPKSYQERAIDAFVNECDVYTTIFEASKIIRKEVLQHRNWKFSGSYSDFDLPSSLSSLLRWIIAGPKTTIDSILMKKEKIDTRVDNISQIIVKATKSNRQVSHTTSSNFREVVETPFSVGLGIHVHKETRNKKLIDCLSELGISISYDRIMKIENGLGNAVMEEILMNNGIFVPPNIQPQLPLHFAIDNIDFKNDTTDGKLEFHGTTHVAFQAKSNTIPKLLKINPTRSFTFDHTPFISEETCLKPNPPNEIFLEYLSPRFLVDISSFTNADRLWGFSKIVDEEKACYFPTWAAFNSLLVDNPSMTVSETLPLYPGSPTDWNNLYTALKLVQGINIFVTGSKRTIVTLDLQLYSKCMQLRHKEEIKNNFIFRLGELHIVFAFLKVMGKYIFDSGLDRLFIEADIYGPTTLAQILDGKHMKRGMEAHMIMYLSLLKIYFINVSEMYPEIHTKLIDMIHNIYESMEVGKEHLRNVFEKEKKGFETNGISEIMKNFDNSLKGQALFLRNYMRMYEVLLCFTRASREANWELHLSSLDAMVPYFFAHDQLNYARLSPLYLATMMELREHDVDSWMYLTQNFCINKTGLPFSSIGSDHALEQENKLLKVTGGVVGLTQNPAALNRFCVISPALNALSKAFCNKNNILAHQNRQHYQLTGSKNDFISSKVQKVTEQFSTFGVDFNERKSVFNLISKAILSVEAANELLNHVKIGEEMHSLFVADRVKGEISIWSSMKKRNLKTFRSQAKVVNSKVGEKLIQLKEERSLLSRFLITARKRPGLNLEESIGSYEFSVVPKSLFTPDGQPLDSSDKAKILHEIEKMAEKSKIDDTTSFSKSVIIIDGMALVHKVHKDKGVHTWKDFAERFVDLLKNVSHQFSEVRLVFDRYIQNSLKSRTRRKRTSGNEVRYKISSNSDITEKSLKQLLGHIETKQDLTEYLAHYAMNNIGNMIRFSVTYSKVTETNMPQFSEELKNHDHEEADTLLILHAIDVAKQDQSQTCTILSPDTDVFLLLLYYHHLLPHITYFRTGRGDKEHDISIKNCYDAIGSIRASSILGFHVFTGCDQIGRFFGKTKISWWKEFIKADENILKALSNLGTNEMLPDIFTLENIERFVVNVYADKMKLKGITTLAKIRWHLFSKFQCDASKLPPTKSTLKYKILRSHFVCIVLKRSGQPNQHLPSPEKYGWELNDTSLDPIMTDNLPAPTALIDLSACKCKGDCNTKRCKCFKNELSCMDMCQCINCKNDNFLDVEDTDSLDLDVNL